MRILKGWFIIALVVLGLGVGVAIAATSGRDAASERPRTAPTGDVTTPAARDDVSGPCDEAEHANDPRCTGATVRTEDRAREPGEDVRGPCDEAEHANDPRCTGVGVDPSEPSGGDDDGGRRGARSSSGRGGSSGGGGNSGPGR